MFCLQQGQQNVKTNWKKLILKTLQFSYSAHEYHPSYSFQNKNYLSFLIFVAGIDIRIIVLYAYSVKRFTTLLYYQFLFYFHLYN